MKNLIFFLFFFLFTSCAFQNTYPEKGLYRSSWSESTYEISVEKDTNLLQYNNQPYSLFPLTTHENQELFDFFHWDTQFLNDISCYRAENYDLTKLQKTVSSENHIDLTLTESLISTPKVKKWILLCKNNHYPKVKPSQNTIPNTPYFFYNSFLGIQNLKKSP